MSGRHEALVGLLADGALHSGAQLAAALGVSRAAVWKIVGELRARGVPVRSVARRGYCLPHPVELLDASRIARAAAVRGWPLGQRLEVLFEIDSTNRHLYGRPAPQPGAPQVTFAELQRAGRGRRGRTWLAPFGSGLTFSVAWSFAETPAGLSALGLAVGAGVAEALRGLGLSDAAVKWPNDLVWRGRKLGGLLLQLRSEAGGPASVVAGLGVNVRLDEAARRELATLGGVPVADLHEAFSGQPPGRNDLVGALAAAMLAAFDEFARAGFAAFAGRWSALDALAGAYVRVMQGSESFEGEACGVDADGALLLRRDGRLERFYSGDVSVRPAGVT